MEPIRALVYMTPFFGGILADRLLAHGGCDLGGLLMATVGKLVLMLPNQLTFFWDWVLLIVRGMDFQAEHFDHGGTLYPA
jgi:POT family proton-dependent oligopeptide transporter